MSFWTKVRPKTLKLLGWKVRPSSKPPFSLWAKKVFHLNFVLFIEKILCQGQISTPHFLREVMTISFFSHLNSTPAYDYAPNPDKQWILQVTDRMEPIQKKFTDVLMTKRLQTLQSIDEAIERVRLYELHKLVFSS